MSGNRHARMRTQRAASSLRINQFGLNFGRVRRSRDDGRRTLALHLHVHRGKRSAVLDLRKPEAVAVFLELVRGADVVIDNSGGLPQTHEQVDQLWDRLTVSEASNTVDG